MSKLQEQIFEESKKLVKNFNIVRFLIYFAVSVSVMIIILLILGMLDLYSALFVIGFGLIYSFVRDYFIARYSLKTVDSYYNFLLEKEGDIDLYVPVLERNYQGYFLKKAAIFFKDDKLYFEAFKQASSKKDKQESITVNYGKDFVITLSTLDKAGKVYLYQSLLMEMDYRFSIINIPEVIEKINKRIKGEM